jgi:hypothetical protein
MRLSVWLMWTRLGSPMSGQPLPEMQKPLFDWEQPSTPTFLRGLDSEIYAVI